jgi:hypothetical protein
MDTFLYAYDQPKLNQYDINHLNRPITDNEIEALIKTLSTKKCPAPYGFMSDFTKPLNKN